MKTNFRTYQLSIQTILNIPAVCPADQPSDTCLVGERGTIHLIGPDTYRVMYITTRGESLFDVNEVEAKNWFRKLKIPKRDPKQQLKFVEKHAATNLF